MKRKDRIAAIAVTVVVLAVLTIGYRMLGPHQREISADLRRVDDLRSLSRRLHREDGKPLPANLSAFQSTADDRLRDPLTHAPYEYIPGPGTTYQLCATFAFASKDETETGFQPEFNWYHSAGRHCFQLDSTKWN